MRTVSFVFFYFLIQSLNAQSSNIITHVDKSGVIIGSNNSMTIINKTVINNIQVKKYNQILIEEVKKTLDEKSQNDNKRMDSIVNMLSAILRNGESIPKALESARDSLKKGKVPIDETKFNTLNQEVLILHKDGDFTKYGDEYVFDPTPTIKKGEVAFKSDFNSSPLVPLKKNNNYGYINSKGILVIPYSYDYASSFNENLAIVKKNTRWSLIDTNNTKVFEEFDADTLYQNKNMLMPFFLKNDLDLYVRSLDTVNYPYPKHFGTNQGFYSIDGSSNNPRNLPYPNLKEYETLFFWGGRILMRKNQLEHFSIVDYNGDAFTDLDYETASVSLSTGIASVKKNKSWGYYDLKTNKEIISPRYKWVENFIFDYTIVITFDKKYGLIDRNNHSRVNFGDWKIERMSNNLLKFRSVSKSKRKAKSFITDASLNCIQGDCMITEYF